MRLSDIVKHITKLFEKKRKNPIQLETDSNLESNLKFLKVSDKSTPIQISEDKVNVEGNLTVNGSDVITESSDVDSLDDLSDVSYSSGDLEITSLDTIVAGDLAIDSSGDIELNADGGNILFADGAVELVEMTTSDTKFYFPSGDTADYLSISVAARGQATLATQDSSDAEQGHIILTAEGDVQLDPSTGKTVLQDSTLYVEEQANANAEYGFGGYGQIWVKNSTANELAFTDDAGTDIVGIGKYHYDTKITNYYASATSVFIPLAGYVTEMSGASGAVITGQGEYVSFHAPYNGTLERLMFRSEVAQNGTLQVDLYESADNTETPATEIGTMDTSINIADDTSVEVNFSSMTSGTNAIVKGRVYAVKITSPSASQDTFVTTAWKWDITS